VNVSVPRLKYYARKLGLVGWVGIVLLIFTMGYAVATLPTLHKKINGLEADVVSAAQAPVEEAAEAPLTRSQRMQMFHDFFPKGNELGYWIGRINAAAGEEKLVLERGDYQISKTGEPPMPLRITMPVRGTYGQVRRFINAALMEVPAMALEDISLVRQTARDAQMEAQLRFVIYVRSDK
jgi:Tfp pilus assembly protein PilO